MIYNLNILNSNISFYDQITLALFISFPKTLANIQPIHIFAALLVRGNRTLVQRKRLCSSFLGVFKMMPEPCHILEVKGCDCPENQQYSYDLHEVSRHNMFKINPPHSSRQRPDGCLCPAFLHCCTWFKTQLI